MVTNQLSISLFHILHACIAFKIRQNKNNEINRNQFTAVFAVVFSYFDSLSLSLFRINSIGEFYVFFLRKLRMDGNRVFINTSTHTHMYVMVWIQMIIIYDSKHARSPRHTTPNCLNVVVSLHAFIYVVS